ncbi:hypothetical protein [Arthrobacter sp. OAP107]|uniref:hypothetical protein n=1 Tax=Arthrobacter sp. OAP107 TaxID=3156445 RepID=UPI003396705D
MAQTKNQYDDLHATVVDALRYQLQGNDLDHAAHEVLDRLRDRGLDIPPREMA